MVDDVDEGTLDDVATVIRAVAATAVMPRFGALLASDVTGKGADDIVTVADVEAEEMPTERLAHTAPACRCSARRPAAAIRACAIE